MERNMKVFRVHRALSWLYGGFLIIIATLIATHLDQFDPVVFLPIALLLVAFLAHFLTARGAKACKPWGRICSIVIAIILLFGLPVGTIIGIYLLVNTWQPWQAPQAPGAVA